MNPGSNEVLAGVPTCNRRRALVVVLAPLAGIAMSMEVLAQKKGGGKGGGGGKNGNGKDRKDKANEVHFSGKIKQITPQGLVVDSEDSKHYLIGLGPASEVIVEGQASKSFLAPGAAVEFEVELNREGKSSKEVQAITFVEISNLNPIGLFPTTIAGADENQETATAKPFLARGRITSFKDETLTLVAGSKSLAFKVSKNVSLDARISNWRLALVGDSIKGSGELPPQANLGLTRVVAKRLNIKTASTIEPKGQKRPSDAS